MPELAAQVSGMGPPPVPHQPLQGQSRPNLSTLEDEEDDEEDEESVLQRLPENTRRLREYITASQGFLLLLTLRQHLKDLYGFSDAKISQYSPSESAKVYEKAVNRKNNLQFKPKNTLQRLKENTKDDEELDEEGRRELVKEYLDFKQLMLKFEPEDPDLDDDAEGGGAKRGVHDSSKQEKSSESDRLNLSTASMGSADTSQVQYQVQQVTDHANNSMNQSQGPPRVPKLTIHTSHHHHSSADKEHHRKHRTHKTEKPKKHKKKKRRRLSDSSDSGDDCSDPDYQGWVVARLVQH